MDPQMLIGQLKATQEWLNRSTSCLTEEDSTFVPAEGMMNAAQQMAHVAWTIHWFLEGAFQRADGFDMDFEKEKNALAGVNSLEDARKRVEKAFADAEKEIGSRTVEDMMKPLPEGPVMGGLPIGSIISAICDHTAHHRGTLTVYSRLRGHVPAMPYM